MPTPGTTYTTYLQRMDEIQQSEIYRALEIKKSDLQKRRLSDSPLPPFDLGINYLQTVRSENKLSEHDVWRYADDWFREPEKYLCPEETQMPRVEEKNGFLSFPSLLNNTQTTKFKYDPQPHETPGRKVALLHVMHWNGRLKIG